MKDLLVESSHQNILAAALPAGVHPPAGSGIVFDAWMDSQASAICRGEWEGWPCQQSFDLLREAVHSAGADEGALWLVDDLKRELRPCFSVGSHVGIFLREIRQPLSAGLISMVFFTENSICESDVSSRKEYSPHVDLRLGAKTKAMIAIPVFFAQRCRGVFSVVLFEKENEGGIKDSFQQVDFDTLSRAAALWSELMDSQLAGIGLQFSATGHRS
jgi:hypothetical protein